MKKVGIIGTGTRGFAVYCQNVLEDFKNLNIYPFFLCDKFPERLGESSAQLRKLLSSYGLNGSVLKTSTDYKELIDDPQVDVVVAATPQCFHREALVESIQKGKFTVCDNPIAHTLEDTQNIYDAWQKSRKKNVFVSFSGRFENIWLRTKEIIEQGWIGSPKMMLMRCVVPLHSCFQRWSGISAYSGGLLNEKCSHFFDLFNWFAASRPFKISAMGGRSTYKVREKVAHRCTKCFDLKCPYREKYKTLDQFNAVNMSTKAAMTSDDPLLMRDRCVFSPENDIIDHAVVNIAYENDIKAQLFFSVAGPEGKDNETFEAVGDKGRFKVCCSSGEIQIVYNFGRDSREENHHSVPADADKRMLKKLAYYVHTKEEPAISMPEAFTASKMAFLANDSISNDKVYKL